MKPTESTALRHVFNRLNRHGVVLALLLAVLLPYYRIISGLDIPIPDDIFISDLADGEFPARVEAGRILRQGEWPIWTSRAQSGMPLLIDPLSVGVFALFSPSLALGILLGILLTTGALGTWVLSRHLGASRSGAFIAGLAFTWSGFWVCQLRHLSIIGVVSLFPWALYCIEQAFARREETAIQARTMPLRRRVRWLALFSLVLGMQLLAGFPQSVYISCLIYSALIIARLLWLIDFSRPARIVEQVKTGTVVLTAFTLAVFIAVLISMSTLLPLWELGQQSDRNTGVAWEWITRWRYDIENAWSFIVAYKNGDISNQSYSLGGIFWESYGYAGMITFIAALGVVVVSVLSFVGTRLKKRDGIHESPGHFAAFFWFSCAIAAFIVILGDATPVYRFLFDYLPAFNTFRLPSRFMFVIALAIPLLASIGITRLQQFLEKKHTNASRLLSPALIGAIVALVTWMDIVGHNARQNPAVDSDTWLKPPRNAEIILQHAEDGRTYSPSAITIHMQAFRAAHGWSGDLSPYYAHREFLQPNSNLLHNLSSVNAYAGISSRWAVDLVGDHNRNGMLSNLESNATIDAYFNWLEATSVRWLIYHRPIQTERLEVLAQNGFSFLLRVKNTLPRARFAQGMQLIPDMETLQAQTISGAFDPRREAAIHREEDFNSVRVVAIDKSSDDHRVTITTARETKVEIETRNKNAGLLLLADTWYPGWKAAVDGVETNILRVNVMHRGVVVPAGTHRVKFSFEPDWLKTSFVLTLIGLLAVLATLWLTRAKIMKDISPDRNQSN